MRHWGFWEWLAYACLFVSAMIVAGDTGFRLAPDLAAHLPHFLDSPWWGFAPAALVLTATAILLYREFFARKKSQSDADTHTALTARQLKTANVEAEKPVDPLLYNELVAFSLETLMPACRARLDLTHEIINTAAGSPAISYLTIAGLHSSQGSAEFHDAYYEMCSGLESTAGAVISFSELVELIHALESGAYKKFVEFGDDLATRLGVNPANDHSPLRPWWEDWYIKNGALVSSYERIKKDSRIPLLFRPGRTSRWE